MRVTIVTETYFPQVNGVSRTLGELVRHLIHCGDTVQLIHPKYGPSTKADPHTHLVRSVVLPFYKDVHLPIPPFGSAHRAIKSFDPDVIHIASEATLGLSVLIYAMRHGLNVVSSFHTNFDQYTGHYRVGWARWLIWRYLRWFHNCTRETYVPSEATIGELERKRFERLVLWKRGVDSTLFRPDRPGRLKIRQEFGWSPEDIVVSYVSRIAAEKNIDYLADALAILVSRRPGVRVLMVGDGPSRTALEGRIGTIARFVGYRQGEDLADYYSASDIFAFASLTETFGNVVLEAMSSGLPVVALRAGGVGDTVQSGNTGLLINPSEPPVLLADSLISLVDHREERLRMANLAREYAQSQSWETIMDGLRDCYLRILDRPSAISVSTDAVR